MDEVFEQLEKTMLGLKDFQRSTVDSAMISFIEGGNSRVLVADEVGLGKTIVAKGVIASLLHKHINDNKRNRKRPPFRVTYICSNLTLAVENREKLSVFDASSRERYVREPSFGRLLEIARIEKDPAGGELLELCSLTPSTSFNLTQGAGNMDERFIMFRAMLTHPKLSDYREKLSRYFQYGVKDSSWNWRFKYFDDKYSLNKPVIRDFHASLRCETSLPKDGYEWLDIKGKVTYLKIIEAICQLRKNSKSKKGNEIWLYRFIIQIRQLLARSCATNLNADLFILDEFQRFKGLLTTEDESEESLITREVFREEGKAKVLLLSATPFKAMTRLEEDEDQSAHLDELRFLLRFLTKRNEELLVQYEVSREELLNKMLSLRDESISVSELSADERGQVEDILSPYICRTERAQISKDFDAVFKPVEYECIEQFAKGDINSYIAIAKLGSALNQISRGYYASQTMEFSKSSPWPISFLGGYQFRKRLDECSKLPEIRKALNASKDGWLQKSTIQNYKMSLADDAPNARLKYLVGIVFDDNGAELLWVPPSVPYYSFEGPFKNANTFSKSLLFSAWAMVPRSLSGLLSYEAERRNLKSRSRAKRQYFGSVIVNPVIRFEGKAGLNGWALVYPSATLSEISLVKSAKGLSERKFQIRGVLVKLLATLEKYCSGGSTSKRWYAFAPMLLDIENDHEEHFRSWHGSQMKAAGYGDRASGRLKHLEILSSILGDDVIQLGPMPEDLLAVLVELVIAGPGICAVRAWKKLWAGDSAALAENAGIVGMGLTQIFNKPEAISIISKLYSGNRHWRNALGYCLSGNLQALIDEYAHLLHSSGMDSKVAAERVADVCVVTTSNVACQFWENRNMEEKGPETSLRCHYAVPLGIQKMTEESGVNRSIHIRDAFNSPFRPFVLNSTSIGQEGLDFHWYCSRVIHWNLPSNPIDIEQREGRVNRYKSLVVRRRVAEVYSSDLSETSDGDIWENLFDIADQKTKENRESNLVPYWHLPEGSAQIERVVPMMPMSREVSRLKEALKILSLYRLAFGQPRQEELLKNLLHRKMNDKELNHVCRQLVINLSPHARIIKEKETLEPKNMSRPL